MPTSFADMAGQFTGKTALVTGSTSNIGRAIALAYAATTPTRSPRRRSISLPTTRLSCTGSSSTSTVDAPVSRSRGL
ncbi:hypothetical protein [Nocardia sp. bgisy118]|uniref:hypothetical protein n=1 Tax=Nocardia sp. bgisy118 TaxID=3413786 RepID=UPI003F4A0716